MRKSYFSLILVGLLLAGLLTAVEQVKSAKIEDIVGGDPYQFHEVAVSVEGIVTQYGEAKTEYTRHYLLRGDYAGIIKVITESSLPEVNERYEVRGVVIIDNNGEVCIIEKLRKKMSDVVEYPKSENPWGRKIWMYMIITAALLLLFAIILTLIMLSNKKKIAYLTSVPGAAGFNPEPNIPAPANVIEGSTIKIAEPPPGTLKLLPGKFEVVSGENTIKEIRFYKTKNREETEITFGRGIGPDYSHIHLKPLTVSLKQAKLIWTNGNYTLINHSTTNPTMVNGSPLAKDGSVILADGDKIEMGEIAFVFHEK